MAKLTGVPKADLQITLEISYQEAKAMHALTVYGSKPFVQAFYKVMGRAYLEPHEAGLLSIFEVFSNLSAITARFEESQAVFQGYKIAVRSKSEGA